MTKSNKPSWDDAPEWANYLACDGTKVGAMIGQICAWWWYEEEPMISESDYECWTNHVMTKYQSAEAYASPEWAKINWKTSVEKRPTSVEQQSPEHYVSASNARRVTLFIDFDDDVCDDEQLSRNIAETLCNRLGTKHPYKSTKFTPGGASVDRIRISIGKTLMDEIAYGEDGFYIKED